MGHFKDCKLSGTITLVVLSMMSEGVWAKRDAGAVDLGGVLLIPRLEVKAAHDDNIFDESKNPKSSTFIQTAPSVEFKAQQGLDVYSLIFEADNNHYTSASKANHTNGGVALSLHKDFTSRNRVDLGASVKRLHDLSAANNVLNFTKPTAYDQKTADLRYGFGREDARVHIDLFGDIEDRDYKARAFESKNSRSTLLGTTLYYRVAPKTRTLVEFKRKDLAYDKAQRINGIVQKSELSVDSYLVGLTWDATEKTNGYAKIGQRKRKSSVHGVRDEKSTGWEVGVSYQATSRALLQLSTSRDFGLDTNSPVQSFFTDGVNTKLSWSQQWTDKINSNISWSIYDEQVQDAQGRNLLQRDTNEVAVQLGWNINHRVSATFGYTHKKRDEKLKAAGIHDRLTNDSLSRNLYSIGVNLSI